MKFPIIILGLLLTLSAQAKVVIVSDIDDTIKQSNVLNKGGAIKNYLFGSKDFPHMATVLGEIIQYHKGEEVQLSYISGSIKCFVMQKKWLAKHPEFPAGLLIQRKCNNGEFGWNKPTKEFKIKAISALLRAVVEEGEHDVYLFGDNGQHDPEVYAEIQKLFPQFTYHIYVRDIAMKAMNYEPRLTPVRVPFVNYFLSELDFFETDDLNFLSSGLKEALKKDFEEEKLFASYQKKTLAKRLRKEGKVKRKESKELAQDILKNYY